MGKTELRFFWLSTFLVSMTGLLYWLFKFGFTSNDPLAVINHPMEPWMIKSHILFAPFLVFSLGSVFVNHAWPRFVSKTKCGRKSGLWNLGMIAVMIISGYGLQVVSTQEQERVMVWVHSLSSFGFILLLFLHFFKTRKLHWKRK